MYVCMYVGQVDYAAAATTAASYNDISSRMLPQRYVVNAAAE